MSQKAYFAVANSASPQYILDNAGYTTISSLCIFLWKLHKVEITSISLFVEYKLVAVYI